MAFGSTLTITVNAVAKVLNRLGDINAYASQYMLRSSTDEYLVDIKHSKENAKGIDPLLRGMDRHTMVLTHSIFATATTPKIVRQVQWTIRCSPGDDPALVSYFSQAAGSYAANATRVDDVIAWLS